MGAVDTEVLADLERLGGIGFVAEMLAMAVDSMHSRIDELLSASDAGDLTGVARAAHALVSSSGTIGAERIRRIAATIEGRAQGDLHDPAAGEITGLRGELAAFEAEARAVCPLRASRSPSLPEGGPP